MKKLMMSLFVAALATSSAFAAAATATSLAIDSTSTPGVVVVDLGNGNDSGWHFVILGNGLEFGKQYELADMDTAWYNNQGVGYPGNPATITITKYKGGYKADGGIFAQLQWNFTYSDKITLDITSDAEVVTSKLYDGLTDAEVISAGVIDESAIWGSDDVTLTATAAFDDANVGEGKTVTVTYSLEGADAEDYVLSKESDVLTNGVIDPVQLEASMIELNPKAYDGTDTINVSDFLLVGVVTGETVTGKAYGQFADKMAKMNKNVTVKFEISGSAAANYIAPADSAMKVTISRKKAEFVGTAVEDKEYDGGYDAIISDLGTLDGLIEGDDVTYTAQAVYFNNDKNVGEDKDVLVKYTVSGADAENYIIRTKEIPLKASIIKRQLTATGIVVKTAKMEDNSDSASITTKPTLQNVIGVDKVTLSAVAKYDNATFGENKTITIKYTISGADIDNYAAPVDSVYTTEGKIIQETELVLPEGATEFFVVDTAGYVPGATAYLEYEIKQGTPLEYRIICSDEAKEQGFTDVAWTSLPTNDSLPLIIPEPCEPGKYTFGVQMNNELDVPTDTLQVTVMVDLDDTWMDNIFEDMVILVDPESKYAGLTYQWFKNDLPISGATLPYYYEEGGLNGTYFLIMNIGTDDEIRTVKVPYSTSAPKAVRSIRKESQDGQIIIIDEDGSKFNTNGIKLF